MLDKPIEMSEVEAFEKENNMKLPEQYKLFFTEIGNGGYEYNAVVGNSGAGPGYGVFKLGHEYHDHIQIDGRIKKLYNEEPYFTEETTQADWSKVLEDNGIVKGSDYSFDNEDIVLSHLYKGIMSIGFYGSCEFIGIMLSGENKGRVVIIYDEIDYCPSFYTDTTFFDYYENWLDRVICGSLFLTANISKTQQELIERYLDAEEKHRILIELKYIRGLDSFSSEYVKVLWDKYKLEQDEEIKLYLLSLLVKFDYSNTVSELQELLEIDSIEFLKNLHLFAKERILDWEEEIIKLKTETNNEEVREYIKYLIIPELNKNFSK